MKSRSWVVILTCIVLIAWSFIADHASEAPAQEKQQKFLGVAFCKACHTGKIAEKEGLDWLATVTRD